MADIIFLIDGSQSVSQEQFQIMQRFMSSLVNHSSVGEHHVRIGAIVYSTKPEIQFALNELNTKQELRKAISDLKPFGGDTYTSKALSYSLEYFSEFSGGRTDELVRKFLIVLTSGEARDAGQLREASKELRNQGISIFGIGVQQDESQQLRNQLLTITSSQDRVFHVDNSNAANVSGISEKMCKDDKIGKIW